MNAITQFKIGPGVYQLENFSGIVVVKTVITHTVTPIENSLIPEEVNGALVVFEPLVQSMDQHIGYSMPIKQFEKFAKLL